MWTKLTLVFFLALTVPAVAQSGHPEISVTGIQAPTVKAQITNEMFNRGFTILSDTPNLIVFDRINNNFAAVLFFGTSGGGAPHVRVAYSLADFGGSTRVVADIALVANAGTAFERRTDLNFGQDAAEAQALLNTVAVRVAQPVAEAAKPVPEVTAPKLP